MTLEILAFTAASLVASLLFFFTPTKHLQVTIVAISSILLMVLAPASLLWAVLLTLVSCWVMQRSNDQFVIVAGLVLTAAAALLILREQPFLAALGSAYFTLRIVHVVLEWWMERLAPPKFLDLLSYVLFLPTFLAGPINRYPNFTRQIARRRTSEVDLYKGIERVLIGLFMIIVLGGWFVGWMTQIMRGTAEFFGNFGFAWLTSAWGWIELYFTFAGLSSVAIGCALVAGISIEENFNHPYKARSLVEFWSRWHMSLTSWCRDYVYKPIAVSLRSPILGVLSAMLVLGLWHETSAYYVLWSCWQAAGIIFSQLARPAFAKLPVLVDRVVSPFLILGWLSLAKPTVNQVLGLLS